MNFYETISRLYLDAQLRLLDLITRYTDLFLKYPERQGSLARQLDNELRKIVDRLGIEAPQAIYKAMEKAYQLGIHEADKEISQPQIQMQTINTLAIEQLAAELIDSLTATHPIILHSLGSQYSEIVANAATGVITGIDTRRQGAQRLLNNLADKGITSFIDRSGRSWDMASYTEMASRTATARAQIKGHMDRLSDNGFELVQVSSHRDPSPLCKPWQGRVFTISGWNPNYPPLQVAINGGLYHPNCRHSVSAYVEGDPIQHEEIKEGDYEERQKQRYMERQIRKWKQREAVALSDVEKSRAHSKVREWQAIMRKFIHATDLHRDYGREQIGQAR